MGQPEIVFVKCRIKRGGFSGERIVEIALSNQLDFRGIVPIHYCFDEWHNKIDQDHPISGTEMIGYVQALLIRNGGEAALVSLPGRSDITVSTNQVFRIKTKESEYVSLGS